MSGLSYFWTYTHETDNTSAAYNFMTFDGAGFYEIEVADNVYVEGSGRAGLAMMMGEYTVYNPVTDEETTDSVSENSIVLSIGGGALYRMDNLVFGGELRIPIMFLNDKFKDFDGKYLLVSGGLLF